MLPNPYVILGLVAAFLLATAGAFFEGEHYKTLQYEAAASAAKDAELVQLHQSDTITADVGQAAALKEQQIAAITQTQILEIPKYVTIKSDAACTVPVGFVRLHDAAAAGLPLPDAAGQSDDAASGVALHTVAGAVAANYGNANLDAAQLAALIGWIEDQAALMNKAQPAHR